MKEFQVDFKCYATLYVKAESLEAAVALFDEYAGLHAGIELGDNYITLDENQQVELSPMMTAHGYDPDAIEEYEP